VQESPPKVDWTRLKADIDDAKVIHPDEDTLAALASTGGQMNPASGRRAAIAGRLHGQRIVSESLKLFWE